MTPRSHLTLAQVDATSSTRRRATAAERRLHGGSTVTTFLVRQVGTSDVCVYVDGYGPTPGQRKTDAKRRFLAGEGK